MIIIDEDVPMSLLYPEGSEKIARTHCLVAEADGEIWIMYHLGEGYYRVSCFDPRYDAHLSTLYWKLK